VSGSARSRTGGAVRHRPGRALAVDSIEAIEDALIAADVGLPATERIIAAVKTDREGALADRVARVMLGIFRDARPAPALPSLPHVILLSASTARARRRRSASSRTSIRTSGRSVLICAADTFRAAAVEQLRGVGRASRRRSRARAIGRRSRRGDVRRRLGRQIARPGIVIVDTAGRLHTRAN
jgi:fused signal recognition particle receptor